MYRKEEKEVVHMHKKVKIEKRNFKGGKRSWKKRFKKDIKRKLCFGGLMSWMSLRSSSLSRAHS
jgi:hypothetical protein